MLSSMVSTSKTTNSFFIYLISSESFLFLHPAPLLAKEHSGCIPDEVLYAVTDENFVDIVPFRISRHRGTIIPQVQQVDLTIILGQERRQGVTVTVPHHQKCLVRGGIGVANNIKGVIASHEGRVLVLFAQEAVHIEAVGLLIV